jgi:hypothetical protein
MTDQELQVHISGEEALYLLELTEIAVKSRELAGLAQEVLPIIVRVMGVAAALLYFEEHSPFIYSFFKVEVQDISVPIIEKICAEQFNLIQIQADFQPLILSLSPQETGQIALFLLHSKGKRLGLLGLLIHNNRKLPDLRLAGKVIFLLSQFIAQLVERLEYDKRIDRLNAYFAVSSKIAKAINFRDVIEAVLYSSMEAVSAEAASLMLLDDEKKTLNFSVWYPPSRP